MIFDNYCGKGFELPEHQIKGGGKGKVYNFEKLESLHH